MLLLQHIESHTPADVAFIRHLVYPTDRQFSYLWSAVLFSAAEGVCANTQQCSDVQCTALTCVVCQLDSMEANCNKGFINIPSTVHLHVKAMFVPCLYTRCCMSECVGSVTIHGIQTGAQPPHSPSVYMHVTVLSKHCLCCEKSVL